MDHVFQLTDEELTKMYNAANNIPDGKSPPITTQRIFLAMREAYRLGQQESDDAYQSQYMTASERADMQELRDTNFRIQLENMILRNQK